MAKMLFCIEHERMVYVCNPEIYGLFGHPEVNTEMDLCEFPLGWATCPPPEFDLDQYIQEHGQPPAITEDFLPYSYDVDRDEIVEEALL